MALKFFDETSIDSPQAQLGSLIFILDNCKIRAFRRNIQMTDIQQQFVAHYLGLTQKGQTRMVNAIRKELDEYGLETLPELQARQEQFFGPAAA